MTVGELLELLEGVDQDAEVRLATQPSWPLQYKVRGVVTPDDVREASEEMCQECGYFNGCHKDECPVADEEPEEIPNIVYIVEGNQPSDSPYLPGDVRNAAWV